MATYLTSTNLLRENGLFDGNIQESDLKVALTLAQDTMLKDILGTDLYDKLISMVKDGTITDVGNEAYLALLRGPIRDVLTYYTYYNLLSIQAIKITNGGVSKPDREESQQATLEDIRALKSTIKGYFGSYEEDLKHYLLINKDEFPEYFAPSEDDIKPIRTNRVKGLLNINKIMEERDI